MRVRFPCLVLESVRDEQRLTGLHDGLAIRSRVESARLARISFGRAGDKNFDVGRIDPHYGGSPSTVSAAWASAHFSIISWPIANALLPVDLVGPVARRMARAPVGAVPGPGRSANFASLRAWASAAEGARLVDWLRFEAPTGRVLNALPTENRGSVLSGTSYSRLRDAVAAVPEAFFAARAARTRARSAKPKVSSEENFGQLALSHDASGPRLFVSWRALPPALFDEARAAARSAAWRPRLWGRGGFLHPDTA